MATGTRCSYRALAAWVDAHHDVDGGAMQNVRMVYQAAVAAGLNQIVASEPDTSTPWV